MCSLIIYQQILKNIYVCCLSFGEVWWKRVTCILKRREYNIIAKKVAQISSVQVMNQVCLAWVVDFVLQSLYNMIFLAFWKTKLTVIGIS